MVIDLYEVFGSAPKILVLEKLIDTKISEGKRFSVYGITTSTVEFIENISRGFCEEKIIFSTKSGSRYVLRFSSQEEVSEEIMDYLDLISSGRPLSIDSVWRRVVGVKGYNGNR